MNFKYECKRFQRNHQLFNSSSQKILNASHDSKDNSHISSIKSIEDSVHHHYKVPSFSETVTFMQRLDQLESSLEFEKKERFHEYNRLMNIIKQMECKHSSIIYDSEIRYCRSPPKPEAFYNTNNSLLKKVSSSNFLINKNGKQNNHRNQKNPISIPNMNQKNNINTPSFPTCVQRQNPQKIDPTASHSEEDKQIRKELTQELEELSKKLEDKIKQDLSRNIEMMREQVLNLGDRNIAYVEDLIKNHNLQISQEVKDINLNGEELERKIDQSKKNMMQIFQKVIKQIEKVEYVCQQNSRAELDSVYTEIAEKLSHLERKTQLCLNRAQQLHEVMSEQQERISNIERDIKNEIKNKETKQSQNIYQVSTRLDRLEAEVNSGQFLQPKIKQMQNYIQEELKSNFTNNLSVLAQMLDERYIEMERSFSYELRRLGPKIQNMSESSSHLSGRLAHLQSTSQINFNIYFNKIQDILQTVESKFSTFERDRQILIELQKDKKKQIQDSQIKHKNLEQEKIQYKYLLDQVLEQKLMSKMETFGTVSFHKIQNWFEQLQVYISRLIQPHIRQVELFLSKVSTQEELIVSKFLSNCQSDDKISCASTKTNDSKILDFPGSNIRRK